MIFVQAVLRPHGAHGTIEVARAGRVTLCVSPDVLAEVRDVLTRPKLLAKAPALTVAAVDVFLRDVGTFATLVRDVPPAYTLERDPKDSKYIDLALAAGAKWLVTWDADLLDLMNTARADGQNFRQRFPHLQILEPPAFLRALNSIA